jgi:hypothetical protein
MGQIETQGPGAAAMLQRLLSNDIDAVPQHWAQYKVARTSPRLSSRSLCTEEFAKRIDSAVIPAQQCGPLAHIIAGKAVALKIAASDAFRERQERTVAGAQAVADELLGADGGVSVLTGGTDVHLVLCDLRESELDGKQAEDRLHSVGITVNRNAVPFDPRPPAVSSGLRIGTPALATRGLQVEDFVEVGSIIAETLTTDARSRTGAPSSPSGPARSPTGTPSTRHLAERHGLRRHDDDECTAGRAGGLEARPRSTLAPAGARESRVPRSRAGAGVSIV